MKHTTLFIALVSLGCGIANLAAAAPTATTAKTTNPNNSGTASAATPSIDCHYVISGEADKLNPSIVTQWATYAAIQTFTYNYKNIQNQLDQLKNCYTAEGWQSYSKAIQDSKNLQIAQQQQLNVSAQLSGTPQILSSNLSSSPSWNINIPIKVTYKNATHNVTQDLTTTILVSTISGPQTKLGISQIIATPNQTASTPETPTTTTTPNNNIAKPQNARSSGQH